MSEDVALAEFRVLIASALRLIRKRARLTQAAAGKIPGAPDFRTLSHWETRRKLPSLRLLSNYLRALGLDFSDLQRAIDQLSGRELKERAELDTRLVDLERRLVVLERARLEIELQEEGWPEELRS